MRYPKNSVWFEGVGYGIENHGVDPDVVVDITPEQSIAQEDPQLDRAIALASAQIKHAIHPNLDDMLDRTPRPDLKAKPLPEDVLNIPSRG